eukprot:625802-Pleurochrysis_carterae.AAC.3
MVLARDAANAACDAPITKPNPALATLFAPLAAHRRALAWPRATRWRRNGAAAAAAARGPPCRAARRRSHRRARALRRRPDGTAERPGGAQSSPTRGPAARALRPPARAWPPPPRGRSSTPAVSSARTPARGAVVETKSRLILTEAIRMLLPSGPAIVLPKLFTPLTLLPTSAQPKAAYMDGTRDGSGSPHRFVKCQRCLQR